MPHDKRPLLVHAETEEKADLLPRENYPWTNRTVLQVVDSNLNAAPKKASPQYRALLQNRETD